MIRSMTGYARAVRITDFGTLTWELRTVNHRYLEAHFRLPEEFRAIESRLRGLASTRLGRGKFDAHLKSRPSGQLATDFAINEKLIRSLVNVAAKVTTVAGSEGKLSVTDLLRWPGVVAEVEHDPTPMHAAAEDLLGEALAQLTRSRTEEGERIDALLRSRCEAMTMLANGVRAKLPEVEERIRTRLKERLAVLEAVPDADRLEQELLLLAQKMDVAEELDRIDSHVVAMLEALGKDEPVGRRLDFLMQEFNREANTLASKSQDADTSAAAVEMKVVIEQMREQIQNIE